METYQVAEFLIWFIALSFITGLAAFVVDEVFNRYLKNSGRQRSGNSVDDRARVPTQRGERTRAQFQYDLRFKKDKV